MKKFLLTGFALVTMITQAQTWVTQNSNFGTDSAYPLGFSVLDANTAWAYAGDGSGAGAKLQRYTKTTNGGTTWTSGAINIGVAANQVADFAGASATTAYALYITGGTAKGGIYKTINGGTSWTKNSTASMFSASYSFPNVIYFWDENNGVTMGDAATVGFEIYTTSNAGTTWTKVPAANIPAPATGGEYGYTGQRYVAGNTIWFGTDSGRVFKSNDKGLTWTVAQTPIIDFGGVTVAGASGNCTLKDANTAWVIDQDKALNYTTNGGATWQPINVTGNIYADIQFVPGTANTLISAGASSTTGRGSSISTDGGVTWTDLTPAPDDTEGIAGLGILDSNTIYGGSFYDATAAAGGMNKLGSLLATHENTLTKNISVYPNPTKGAVKIVSKDNVKSVQVVDANGRVVKTYSDVKDLNLTGMTAGVYLLRITTESGKTSTTKIIKN